jgi:hypothetical protein
MTKTKRAMIVAITKKNQRMVNKAVKYLEKYNALSSERDRAYDNDEEKKGIQLDRKCENVFDQYLDACYYLPKREVANIEKIIYS